MWVGKCRWSLWHALTVDVWEPMVHHSLQGNVGGPLRIMAGEFLTAWVIVVSEAILGICVAVLLAFAAHLFKMMYLHTRAEPGLGVPVAVAEAPCPGEPDLTAPETPVRYNCLSFTHTHHTLPPHSYTHSHSFPHCHPAGCHVEISPVK